MKIPLIKKMTPSAIAQDIIGVQPMGDIFNEEVKILEPREIGISGIYYPVQLPYGFYDNNKIQLKSVIDWCMETFPYDDSYNRWGILGHYLWYFKNEDDRNWFLLKWG